MGGESLDMSMADDGRTRVRVRFPPTVREDTVAQQVGEISTVLAKMVGAGELVRTFWVNPFDDWCSGDDCQTIYLRVSYQGKTYTFGPPGGLLYIDLTGSLEEAARQIAYPPSTEVAIKALVPTTGAITGGTDVALFGTNFDVTADAGSNASGQVFFGTVAAGFHCLSATYCVAVSPVAAAVGPVYVTMSARGVTSQTTSASIFYYVASPTLYQVSWSLASGGSVALDSNALDTGATVLLESDKPAVLSPPPSVTIPSNASSAPFKTTSSAQGTVTLTATYAGTSVSTTVQVTRLAP
jgi:hypothetical protein